MLKVVAFNIFSLNIYSWWSISFASLAVLHGFISAGWNPYS